MENQNQKRTMYERMKQSIKGAFIGAALGVAVAGCGARSGLLEPPTDSGMQDGSMSDVVMFDSRKADATKTDAKADATKPDSAKTDSGVPPQYLYTVKNLIGDYLNRDLLDRDKGKKDYPLSVSETDSNANPFSDGAGGSIGPAETNMYRLDGNMVSLFLTTALADGSAGKVYHEQQDIWVSGDSHYSESADSVVGKITSLTYSVKFEGASDDLGIPVCTTPTNVTHYETCDIDYQTAKHKVAVKFLGKDWIISEMSPPTTALSSEIALVNGGHVTLAREAISGILNVTEKYTMDNLEFRYDGHDSNNPTSAIISVLDLNGNLLKKDTVVSGTTKEFIVAGKAYKFHLYKISPNYSSGADWMDGAVFSNELKLQSGQSLDPDYGNNKYWKVYLGWKNKGASTTDTQPDHLRTIILYADDISSLSSSGTNILKPGDYIPIPQDPVGFTFGYKGLTNGNHSSLKAVLEKTAIYTIAQSVGPLDSSGQRVQCTITAPYVVFKSGATSAAFTVDKIQGAGTSTSASGNEFYVATSGAVCGGAIGKLMQGSLFMQTSSSSSSWAYLDYKTSNTSGAISVKYPIVGDGVSNNYVGLITYATGYSTVQGFDFAFNIDEEAGTGVSKNSKYLNAFGLKLDGAASTFNFDDSYSYFFKKDNIRTDSTGPVIPCNSGCFLEEGGITDRGSQFVQITNTLVEFKIAETLVHSQFYIAKK